MQAFIIEKPGKWKLINNLPEPQIQPEEALLRVRKVGFCGSDLNTFRGLNPIVSYPRIPGHEIAAEIVATGTKVPSVYQPGDKVLVLPYTTCGSCWSCLTGHPNACRNNQTLGVQQDGGMTEYLAVHHTKLISDINDLSFNEIALVEPLAVGFHAARRAELQQGEIMLVFGCGLVGLGAIAKGAHDGATVIAVDIDDNKLGLAHEFGAAYTIDSQTENLRDKVLDLTNGHGAAISLEAIGLQQTFVDALELTAFSGRVVYVGYVKDPVAFDTKSFIMKEIQIRGSRNATRQDFAGTLDIIKESGLPIRQLISRVVHLTAAGDALEQWSEVPSEITKILVSFEN